MGGEDPLFSVERLRVEGPDELFSPGDPGTPLFPSPSFDADDKEPCVETDSGPYDGDVGDKSESRIGETESCDVGEVCSF